MSSCYVGFVELKLVDITSFLDAGQDEAVLTAVGGLTFPQSKGSTSGGNGTGYETTVEELEEATALEPGAFCLAQQFTDEESKEWDGLVAVYCNSCLDKVTCSYTKQLYQVMGFNERDSEHRDKYFMAVDIDGNGKIDFEEFHSKLKEYLAVVFNALDSNKDGSVYDEAMDGNIMKRFSRQTFDSAVGEVKEFFDSNKDDAISLDDAFFQPMYWYQRIKERNGKVTLEDIIGDIITLPAPLYNLYNHLDQDKDEALTRDEALNFIHRTFDAIDTNTDCHIDSDEVVALLQRVGVPWDLKLAVKMLLEQYLTLASHIVNAFVKKADVNNLNKVRVEEVINFNDFEFSEKAGDVFMSMLYPSGALSHLIPCGYADTRPCRSGSREESDAMLTMWLTALQVTPGMATLPYRRSPQGVMEEPAFSGAPPATICSSL
jgi:Ca2+-binding EF-hand superfamily protein